jgi:hypothetical protein
MYLAGDSSRTVGKTGSGTRGVAVGLPRPIAVSPVPADENLAARYAMVRKDSPVTNRSDSQRRLPLPFRLCLNAQAKALSAYRYSLQ